MIFNNSLFLNKDLFRFKIIDSPICSYCSMSQETTDHLFVYSAKSSLFYTDVAIWAKMGAVFLPELNVYNIVLEFDLVKSNCDRNFILTLYKLSDVV